jgi:hypothetical protein
MVVILHLHLLQLLLVVVVVVYMALPQELMQQVVVLAAAAELPKMALPAHRVQEQPVKAMLAALLEIGEVVVLTLALVVVVVPVLLVELM